MTAYRVPFPMPPVMAATRYLSPGAWRLRQAPRRKAGMWQVRDDRNDVLAVVYSHVADARVMAAAPRMLSALKALALAAPHSQAYVEALNCAEALLKELDQSADTPRGLTP